MAGIRAKIHRLSEEDLAERTKKIERMLELGCAYEDIARRYGLKTNTVRTLISKGKVKAGVGDNFGHSNNIARAMYVDG